MTHARRASCQPPGPQRLTCKARTKSGKRCSRPPMGGKPFCNFHTPGLASKAGKIGGPRRRLLDPTKLAPFEAPRSAQELAALVAETMIEVRGAKLEPRVANSLSCLGSCFLQALQHGDLEERLTKLEAADAARSRRRP